MVRSRRRSLGDRFPELARQWHPIRNGALTPSDVSASHDESAWWQCPEGQDHVWQVAPHVRTRAGTGCPFCAGQQVSVTNSLATQFPEIAREWHRGKNYLTPDTIVGTSTKRAWWQCSADETHQWIAVVASRTRKNGTGCPYCHGLRPDAGSSLAAVAPRLAREWHSFKNGELTPHDLKPGSHAVVWWSCPNGHDYDSEVRSRTKDETGCPYCSGHRVSPEMSLASCFPKIAKEWHPDRNGDLTARDVVPGSGRVVWWRCPKVPDHEWTAIVNERTSTNYGHRCPFCSGRRASATSSLRATSPKLAAEWHPTKNGELTPDEVTARSNKKVWWKCPKGSDHEWCTTIGHRTQRLQRCPFCVGKQVSRTGSLLGTHPQIAAQWHPTKNPDLAPSEITAASIEQVWWICPRGPDHVWSANVRSRIVAKHPCPFCAGIRLSVTSSLAAMNPALARDWHPTRNGELRAEDVVPGSNRRVWWKCAQGPDHEWEADVHVRSRGTACPFCAGKRLSMTTCLATTFPKVAREWDAAKNGSVTPMDVFPADRTHAWWLCPLGHSWRASVFDRTAKKRACPLCASGGLR